MPDNNVVKIADSISSPVIYLVLILLTMANGLTYDLVVWLHMEDNLRLSPALLLTVAAIIISLRNTELPRVHPVLLTLWCIGVTFPSSTVSWAVLLFVAVYYFLNNKARNLHGLMFVLSLTQIMSSVLSKIVSYPILNFESWLIGLFVRYIAEGAYVVNNIIVVSDEHALSISVGCSALLNVPAVLLAWMSSCYIIRQDLPSVLGVFWVVIAFFFLNTARILIMAIDQSWYSLVHDGAGVQIFDILVMLLVLSPILVRIKQ